MSQELHVNPEYPDELPYRRFLDHGFVALIDVMGDDASIVQAARVSYGKGTKTMRSDAALISYLMRHAHSTPFEMVEFKFLVRLPIFIARQMVRHRTACLAEGTEVYFDLPGGIRRRGNQLYKLKIEDIWKRFQPTRNQIPTQQRNPHFKRDRVQDMRLRQVNEDTLEIQHTRVRDVFKNGMKPVFRVVLSDGKKIEATADHQFLFEDGWNTLKEATGLSERSGRAVWRAGDHRLYVNGQVVYVPTFDHGSCVREESDYRDEAWLHEQYHVRGRNLDDIAAECDVTTHAIRRWLRIHGICRAPGHRPQTPWNKGKQYRLGRRELSKAWIDANQAARSGPSSNFWKGGTSTDRQAIGRWTTQVAPKIHARNGWTCQLCHQPSSELHCHHIVPVWADESKARDEANLTSLCAACHRSIQGRELEFVESLGGEPVKVMCSKRPREAWNKLTVAKLVSIERFEYVGLKETYDLEVEGPFHNFIANGIVTHNSINEYSGRYSVMPDRFWAPSLGAIAEQDNVNRQGRLDKLGALLERLPDDVAGTRCRYLPELSAVLVAKDGTGISREALREHEHRCAFAAVWSEGKQADLLPTEAYGYWVEQLLEHFPDEKGKLVAVQTAIREQNEKSYALYLELLERGVAREIARTVLPLTMYTEWYWKIDLHNLFHFLRLRLDAHAQFEIRALGEAMATFVKPRVPAAWEAFYNDRVEGTFLSSAEREVLQPVDEAAQRDVLTGLYERGYRSRRLKEVCRKLNMDERLVDELWPPKQ